MHTCQHVCMRRSAADAAETRRLLLGAALLVFEEKGWRGATFERVAERAGVTRGALNHHFRDKSSLLSEALEQGWSEYGTRVFAHLDERHGAAGARLAAFLGEYVRLLTGDEFFRALASTTVLVAPQAFPGSPEKSAALDEWRDRLTAVVAADVREGAISAREVAALVVTLLQGFTVAAAMRPHDLPRSENIDAAMALIVSGLLT